MYPILIVVLILATATSIKISHCGTKDNFSCPAIIPRATWGGRSPKKTIYIGDNLPYVIIHETGGPQYCFPEQACMNRVKSIQDYHMNEENNSNDINYNFLVDHFGNIYEGRGWEYKGNHEINYNLNSIGIGVIGSFKNTLPTEKAIAAIKDLIKCGVRFEKLHHDYKILVHRQVKDNDCPGIKFYELIKTWPNWENNMIE